MKRIINDEIKFLKHLNKELADQIRERDDQIRFLQNENAKLTELLYEARANEGRGVLERACDTIIKGLNTFIETLPQMPSDRLIELYELSTNEYAEDPEP